MATTPAPTETTQITSNIPDWAKDYASRLLGRAEQFSEEGYQPYVQTDAEGNTIVDPATGLPMLRQRLAGFNPQQMQAFQNIAGMQTADQLRQATGMAGLAGLSAAELGQYRPARQRQFYRSAFDRPGGLDRYMSPYMQGVVEQQKRAAIEDYRRQIPGIGAQAARFGARGGTREALLQSEAQRNLQNQLGNIQATGLQGAYQQAAQQAAQDAAMRAQYGLSGASLAESSRQFGAGLGLQGIQQQLAASGLLGNLGQQQYQQQMGINAAQLGAGGQQQSLEQELLNQQYQDFINAQRLPYQQMEFMSGILRGIPATGQTQQFYQQPGSLFGQIAGVGLGLGSLFGGFGGKS